MTGFALAASQQRFRWFNLTAAILLVGLMVRMLVFVTILANPQRAFTLSDSTEYTQLTNNLITHGSFSLSQDVPLAPDITRTPGYPALLALLYIIAGNQHSAGLIVGVQL